MFITNCIVFLWPIFGIVLFLNFWFCCFIKFTWKWNILWYVKLIQIEFYIWFLFLLGDNSWQSQNLQTWFRSKPSFVPAKKIQSTNYKACNTSAFCISTSDDKINFPEYTAKSFFLLTTNDLWHFLLFLMTFWLLVWLNLRYTSSINSEWLTRDVFRTQSNNDDGAFLNAPS